jgi:S-methylmethionine-dependent homocysteine/selenocysteine methylase
MSSIREAKCAATAASAANMPVWVSWTLHEDASGNLRSSESIADAVLAVVGVKNLQACLLNCCSHESIVAAVPVLKRTLETAGRSDVRIGAYANGFVTVHANSLLSNDGRSEYLELSPEQYLSQVKEWIRLGCTIVGGCCGVFPEHIQTMAEELKDLEQESSGCKKEKR